MFILFQTKKKEFKIVEDKDNELLKRSSLDIPLLPENEQDKKIAELICLQAAKSIGEKEDEKISEILNRPALPSSTITTFGGIKREKLISHRLSTNDLGIVKRKSDTFDSSIEEKKLKTDGDDNVSTNSKSYCNTENKNDKRSSLELLVRNYGNSSDSDSNHM